MANPLTRLNDLGQSVWLDYIRRDMLHDGTLAGMIETDDLAGMTSNPTIFEQAVSGSDLYDADILGAGADASPDAVFERLAVTDIRAACDHFRPLYERTATRDGYVSIEVRPSLAYDTAGTIDDVRKLWATVDRPNVMIKIPGTREGLPAVRQSLTDGINVNVTLLFSVERYHEVVDAWFDGVAARVSAGEPIDRLASVASFFVSRVDTAVDRQLAALIEAGSGDPDRIRAIEGQTGNANAQIAYEAFEERFRGAGFDALGEHGALVQRPLWASTSTKNPEYPDVYYVEALVASDSVNTLPPKTLEAYRDHGDPAVRIADDLDRAHRLIDELGEIGIDFAEVTRALEEEGVRKFSDSYDALMDAIREEQRRVPA